MKYKEVINLNKTKSEKLIERMYFLEHGKLLSCHDILYIYYIEKEMTISEIEKYFIKIYGTKKKILKKNNIKKKKKHE